MSLNTVPRTWVVSELVTAVEMNTEIRDALTGIQAAYDSYTPALTASTTNPTIGTGGAVTGKWLRIGKNGNGFCQALFGTAGVAAGSGLYALSLPVAVKTDFTPIGSGYFLDASANTTVPVVARLVTSTTFRAYFSQTSAGLGISSTAPVVPAANDLLSVGWNVELA